MIEEFAQTFTQPCVNMMPPLEQISNLTSIIDRRRNR